jgi:peptide-methionine (S)-S-oxide reductase
MKKIMSILLLVLAVGFVSCGQQNKNAVSKKPVQDLSNYSVATFASGCFWCVEAVYESVKGVEEAVSGYAGGEESNPNYELVGSNTTRHAETVQVYYDSTMVDYKTLLQVYFDSQNPTQVNGQGPDNGISYRSIIFYRNMEEKKLAEAVKADVQKKFSQPVAAEIAPFQKFWPAEDYHQDYVINNPDVPYVRGESIPRIKRFQEKHPELIKENHKY